MIERRQLGDNDDTVLHQDASVMKINRERYIEIFIIVDSLQLVQEALVNVWKLLQPENSTVRQ